MGQASFLPGFLESRQQAGGGESERGDEEMLKNQREGVLETGEGMERQGRGK